MESAIFNLVVLPLLGGYIFYSKFHGTSFAALRVEGQRLIYSSSVVAVLLILAARAIELFLDWTATNPRAYETTYAVGLTSILAACFQSSVMVAIFGSKQKLGDLPSGRPRSAAASSLILSGAGVVLYVLHYDFAPGPLLRVGGLLASIIVLLAPLSRWVHRTSQLHSSIVVSRVCLLVLSLSAGFVLVLIYGPAVARIWPRISSIEYSGIALLAGLIGGLAWLPFNVVLTEKWAWKRAHTAGQTESLNNQDFALPRKRKRPAAKAANPAAPVPGATS